MNRRRFFAAPLCFFVPPPAQAREITVVVHGHLIESQDLIDSVIIPALQDALSARLTYDDLCVEIDMEAWAHSTPEEWFDWIAARGWTSKEVRDECNSRRAGKGLKLIGPCALCGVSHDTLEMAKACPGWGLRPDQLTTLPYAARVAEIHRFEPPPACRA